MTNPFNVFSETNLEKFEAYFLNQVEQVSGTNLEESMNYSLDANGKRLRPLLLLAVIESFQKPVSSGFPAAAALEMIHTYSLIHDDLPAMDDDELRRGKPTNHIQFDVATAILAGDAILTLAFEVMTDDRLSAEVNVRLVRLLAEMAGYKGMVGGQKADLDGENSALSLEEIEQIHLRKTGALIRFATVGGGIISNQPEDVLSKLADFSKELGIAYQIRDDILDVVGTEEELGKGVATDAEHGKSTYPSLLGLEGSYNALAEHLYKGKEILKEIQKVEREFSPELLESFLDSLTLEEYK